MLIGYSKSSGVGNILDYYDFVNDYEYSKKFYRLYVGTDVIPDTPHLGYATTDMMKRIIDDDMDVSVVWMCDPEFFETVLFPPETITLIEEDVYEQHLFSTDKMLNDSTYCYIDSYTFYAKFNERMEKYEDWKDEEAISFREWTQKYDDEEYFDDNMLLSLVIVTAKDQPPKLDSIYRRSDGVTTFYVDYVTPPENIEERQKFQIFIAIPKDVFKTEAPIIAYKLGTLSEKEKDLNEYKLT